MNAGDLARECGVDERGAAVLLNALAGMGYLCKSMGGASADPDQGGPGVYAVAEAYRDALDSRHPLSYVPMLRHMANAQRGWAELARTVRDGKPRTRRPSILGEEEDDRSFIMGINSLAVRTAAPMIRALHEAGVLHFGRRTGADSGRGRRVRHLYPGFSGMFAHGDGRDIRPPRGH